MVDPADRNLPTTATRVAAAVEYNGRAFCGWQRQSHSPSVQAAVESALSYVADESISVACAGRTDTGVHATNQIIHFDTRAQRAPVNWIRGGNSRLPEGIGIHWASPVTDDFHARFAAVSRTYRYVICNTPVAPAIFRGFITWCRASLDERAMQEAAQGLLGENDFSAFRAAGCQSRTPWRRLDRLDVRRQGRIVVIEVVANAFLHHMVRNIAGCLMAVGRGDRGTDWPGQLLGLGDRTRGEATAPSDGLYLVGVDYPERFAIPRFEAGPILLEGGGF